MGIHYGQADFINYGKPSLLLDFARNKSLVDRISGNNLITFERASIGTYVGADGLIKTAAADEPRFDHNPTTGESLGLLIEEQRTNLLSYSENFSSWTIQTGASITANQGIAPDGTLTASFLTGTGMVNNGVFSVPSASVSTTSNSTKSIYLRSVSGTPSVLLKDPYLTINIQVVNLTTEWQRFSLTEIQSSGLAGIWIDAIPAEGIYAWGAQIEEGSFPTSYIPTSGSEFTREPDKASITGTNFSSWYNSSSGTYIANIKNNSTDVSSLPSPFRTNSIFTFFGLSGFFTKNITSNVQISQGPISTNPIKWAIYHDGSNGYGMTINGRTPVSGTQAIGTSDTNIQFDDIQGATSFYLNKLVYYPTRLTNTQLQELTQ